MILPALSIRQPWCHAIPHFGKDVENRQWQYPTKFRGRCLIHASQRFDEAGLYFFRDLGMPEFPGSLEYERGGIVGIMDIVDCVRTSDSKWFAGEYIVDNGAKKRNYGLVIANARPLPFQPIKGQLNFFDVGVGADLEEEIKRAA